MIDRYRQRVSALVIEAAKDDPELVLALIGELRASGEVAPDDLAHVERIAQKWVRISQDNRARGEQG